MSTLTQYNVLHYRSLGHHFPYLPVSTNISCSAITKTRNAKQLNINEPAVELLLEKSPTKPVLLASPLASPRKRVILDDPSLQSTWSHRAWVASGSTVVIISLAECISGAATSHIWLQPLLASFVGYLLADLGSGIYHWGIDNYGNASTPIFGSQIEAFQGHHKFPWTITKRFVGTCSGCIMLSQQFHAWAHGTKSKLPPLVVALQNAGVLVSRSQHAAHHRQPYNNNYCIVSGVWNQILDQLQVFQTLEMILFFKLGVRPRSWSDPDIEWTEEDILTH
ncbi:Kua-ubiquitin conjugating enzyme hybrid, localization [Heracleum sosnowskyi]|uniref:Kua-ubiquitin conjugating enzyme hybrid, localization n=1 Tax=Heracleum sosnowskyi TaxID=360622 RepID=A0AAD8N1B4_9APIA|nr:Kua-ubiquitin conjugating enzyme hybrid, localization [Heracleum sosnowskyi]